MAKPAEEPKEVESLDHGDFRVLVFDRPLAIDGIRNLKAGHFDDVSELMVLFIDEEDGGETSPVVGVKDGCDEQPLLDVETRP